jgi:asparagine synthase (glutamine-hydrolysing)
MVADRYHTNHHLDIVESDDFGLIDTLAKLYDEPYADSSAIPTYRVCQLARNHVTVALSGDGGDESWRLPSLQIAPDGRKNALPCHSACAVRSSAHWASSTRKPTGPRVFRAKTTFEGIARGSVEAYFHSVSILRAPMRNQLFSQKFKSALGGYNAIEVFNRHAAKSNTDDPLAQIQYLDLKTYLVGDINTKVDRASMAHSLEVREPLMDHELIEWLATLNSSRKFAARKPSTCLKSRWNPYSPTTCSIAPKWVSRCRSPAGSEARSNNVFRMLCSAPDLRKQAGSIANTSNI